jgi:predicted nucleic acid-binding Zn finger protein
MNITQKRGKFQVESHENGRFYTVNLADESCTCPHYAFRLKRSGQKCKHIVAVEEFVNLRRGKKAEQQKSRYEEILEFVRKQGSFDTVKLIEMFGEDEVNFLLFRGDLLDENGKTRLME